ncbi:hypothetical protein ACS0TY_006594 [Phlomoides rotata]
MPLSETDKFILVGVILIIDDERSINAALVLLFCVIILRWYRWRRGGWYLIHDAQLE